MCKFYCSSVINFILITNEPAICNSHHPLTKRMALEGGEAGEFDTGREGESVKQNV